MLFEACYSVWGVGFLGGSVVKNPATMQELQETWVRSLGGEDSLDEGKATHGNQSSILTWRIPVDRGAWYATVHRVAKRQTQLRWLNTHTHSVCVGVWSNERGYFSSNFFLSELALAQKRSQAKRFRWILYLVCLSQGRGSLKAPVFVASSGVSQA